MTTVVTLDFETRSVADLKKVGAWAYSEDPTTEVVCACWAADDGPVQRWSLVDSPPVELLNLADDPEVLFEAHNAAFEYSVWTNVCSACMGWPKIFLHRWRDTMATACYYSLPPDLAGLCRVLGLSGKDPAGDRLITKYSKLHLKTAKGDIPPEDLTAFVDYCAQDVEMERQVAHLLGDLPEAEEEIFIHDFQVAARGLRLDAPGIRTARTVVEKRSADLEKEFMELTGLAPGQVQKVREWLADQGVELDNLQAATIDETLDEADLPQGPARRALELRREHSRASTKKLDAMLRQRGSDGRARFQTRYHGANTGRNTGSGFQPLNLVRNWEDVEPEQLVRDIGVGDPAWLDCVYGDCMEAVGKASRHWITASEGCRIMAGDFSSVEAVVNACLAGEEWKVQLFRDGGDPYVAFASKVVGREVRPKSDPLCSTQDKLDRQLKGKPGELAGGYQGWVGAWRKFDRTDNFTDEQIKEFMGAWREMHTAIVASWGGYEDAAIEAVRRPGSRAGYRDIGFECVDNWLTMILPDGKRLWYWQPRLRMVMPSWHKPDEFDDCASGDCRCEPRPAVHYMARKEGRWKLTSTYGGKLCENAVQAVSRQLLKPCELELERRGYPVVLSVYDEIVCDVPNGYGSAEEYGRIVADTIDGLTWAQGWPITMEAPWEGQRYKK